MSYAMELLENGQYTNVSKPKYVAVTLESDCNLFCKHCYWTHNKENAPQVLDWLPQIQQLVDWDTEVAYAGRTLTKRGVQFIERYHKASGKQVGIVDNGYTILNHPRIMPLYEYVNISVDGIARDHDVQRGKKGACEVAWKAIFALKQAGLDPIISTCVSPINIGNWDAFEEQVCESDTRMSCTPVLGVKGNKGRMPLFSEIELRIAFKKLLSGCGKLIKLADPAHVRALLPILREFTWKVDEVSYETEVDGVLLSYQPLSLDTLTGRNLSWNGKFYVNVDADDSLFDHQATDERVLEVANLLAKEEHLLVRELM